MIAIFLFSALLITYGALCYHDYATHRLPNDLVATAAVLSLLLVVVVMGHPHNLWAAILWPALYFCMWRHGSGIGGGDVKLAVSTAVLASASGFAGVLIAVFVANLMSVGAAVVLRRPVAHGPHMMAASLMVFIIGIVL